MKKYFLIDEIQFVENWQKVINSMRVSFNCNIIITGSNANMLSGELSTLLSGRYVEIKMYPFSFLADNVGQLVNATKISNVLKNERLNTSNHTVNRYLELLRRGYSVDIGKYDLKEIDFIARKVNKILYVQVAYELPNNRHETDNLLKIKDNYQKILITGRYTEKKR